MDDFDEKLEQLEEMLTKTESTLQKDQASMPAGDEEGSNGTCIEYVYIIGAAVPILTVLVLYLVKPSFVVKKKDGKKVVDLAGVAKWTAIVTVGSAVILYIVKYYGYLDGSFCIGGSS